MSVPGRSPPKCAVDKRDYRCAGYAGRIETLRVQVAGAGQPQPNFLNLGVPDAIAQANRGAIKITRQR